MGMMEITLCGGGNGIHVLAPLAASRGYAVNIWAPYRDEAERLQKNAEKARGMQAVFPDGSIKQMPHQISCKAAEVIPGVDLVVIITPAFVHESMLQEIYPLLKEGATLVVIPSRGGLEYPFLSLGYLKKRVDLMGFQTLPWACRIEEYGHRVRVFGVKEFQAVASIAEDPLELYQKLEEIIGVKIQVVENFLSLTLANVGQLIHPGIMFGIVHQYREREFTAEEIPFFYQGVGDSTARILAGLSGEIQMLKDFLVARTQLRLSHVLPLKEWMIQSYGESIGDKSSLKAVFNSNRVYQGLKAPVVEGERGYYVLDKNTRYVQEDLPFGLLVSKGLALLCGLDTPVMDEVITLLQNWMGKEYLLQGELQGRDIREARIPQNYGITSLADFLECIP